MVVIMHTSLEGTSATNPKSYDVSEQLQTLIELQEIDGKLFTLKLRRQNLGKEATEREERLRLATEQFEGHTKSVDDLETELLQLEDDLQTNTDRSKKAEEKLNASEKGAHYKAANKEIKSLKNQRELLEKREKKLRVELEAAEEKKAEQEQLFNATKEEIESTEVPTDEALTQEITALEENRAPLLSKVAPNLLRQYESTIQTRGGRAMAELDRGGRCGLCNMKVPSKMACDVQAGKNIIACPSCQRILFFKEEEEPTEA
jgi:predicted  nucleic acid-binding Zn-ribbon protein